MPFADVACALKTQTAINGFCSDLPAEFFPGRTFPNLAFDGFFTLVSGAADSLHQRPAQRGTAVLSGGDLRSGSLAAFHLFHIFNNSISQNHFARKTL